MATPEPVQPTPLGYLSTERPGIAAEHTLAGVLAAIIQEFREVSIVNRHQLGNTLQAFGFGSGATAGCNQALDLLAGFVAELQDRATRMRPTRINAAGYCLYCDKRYCTTQRCIDLWQRSWWGECDVCGGNPYADEHEHVSCRCCESGVIELIPPDELHTDSPVLTLVE